MRKGDGRRSAALSRLHYEQVLVEASHFMWAFAQADFVFGASAANVGAVKATASPNATIKETRFFMEVSPRERHYLAW